MFFYLSVISLITIHPGITVSFDRIGVLQWFVIIPAQALITFIFFSDMVKFSFSLRRKCVIILLPLFILSVWAGGFSPGAFRPFTAGIISFLLTFLLFNHQGGPLLRNMAKIAALEPFFLAWVCLRLLALSRSGEDIAGESAALTQFILVWTAVVFLLHCVVVYFCAYPQSAHAASASGSRAKGSMNEAAIFFAAAAVLLFTVLLVLPPDFIRNAVINNLLQDRAPERRASDSDHGIPKDSSSRRDGRRTLPKNGGDGQPGLRGIAEHNWQNRTGRGRGGGSQDNRQYMVMVVASDREPVYMGSSFRGHLDRTEGFLVSQNEPLNNLVNQRFFVTWFNNEPDYDFGRRRQEVFSLSTLPQKYLPFRPVSVDPTILSEDSGPLRYIHQVTANTHLGDPLMLVNAQTRYFSEYEKKSLAHYLEIPLEENDIKAFNAYLDKAVKTWKENRGTLIAEDNYLKQIFSGGKDEWEPDYAPALRSGNEYMEKIIALLVSFSGYQYNLNYNDDFSVAALKEFLFNSAEGDCVEFSNTLALLGRLAGIPSRVVTGYLAADSLQTTAHLRGLAALRARIPVLQKFRFDDLFLVTNLHSHSWTQFFIPDYGWLDFEATSFSMPPLGTGDFNGWDVVIPVINETKVFSNVKKFPWRAALRTVCVLAVFAVVLAYTLRYGRELVLYAGVRRGGRAGARSLYLLLLAKLAADGKPVKPASKTAHEYSQLFPDKSTGGAADPHFQVFASLYSQLRWRQFADNGEMEKCFMLLRQKYSEILKSAYRRGPHHALKRAFSLRGLAYL
jgi:hypothetical protein